MVIIEPFDYNDSDIMERVIAKVIWQDGSLGQWSWRTVTDYIMSAQTEEEWVGEWYASLLKVGPIPFSLEEFHEAIWL